MKKIKHHNDANQHDDCDNDGFNQHEDHQADNYNECDNKNDYCFEHDDDNCNDY